MERDTTEENTSHTVTSTNPTQQNTNSQVTPKRRGTKRRREEEDEAPRNRKRRRLCPDVGEDPEVSSANTAEETPSQKEGTQDQAKSREDFFKAQHDEFDAKYVKFYQYRHEGYGSTSGALCRGDFTKLLAVKHIPKTFFHHLPKENEKLSPSEVDDLIGEVIKHEAPRSKRKAKPVCLLDWFEFENEIVVVMKVPCKEDRDHEEAAKITIKCLIKAVMDYEERNFLFQDIQVKKIAVWTDFSGTYHCETDLQCTIEDPYPNREFRGDPEKAPPETFLDCYHARETTVWQLGVVLFEILSNGQTFNTIEYIDGHLTINRVLSKKCKDFYQSCLNFVAMERPQLQVLLYHPWFQESSNCSLLQYTSTSTFSLNSSHSHQQSSCHHFGPSVCE